MSIETKFTEDLTDSSVHLSYVEHVKYDGQGGRRVELGGWEVICDHCDEMFVGLSEQDARDEAALHVEGICTSKVAPS